MELKYIVTQPGDVVIPSGEGDALVVYASGEFVSIYPDVPDDLYVSVHNSQIDDLIEALKIMKEKYA